MNTTPVSNTPDIAAIVREAIERCAERAGTEAMMAFFAGYRWTEQPSGSAGLDKAIRIAVEAHDGQVDRAGKPYILHSLRVMMGMDTEDEKIVAVLHDVPEDNPDWPLERLRQEGFAEHILEALDSVTKRPGETRMEAARRAAGNAIGLRVKLGDNGDNMDPSRIEQPTEKDKARMKEYATVRAILLAALHEEADGQNSTPGDASDLPRVAPGA